MYVCLFVNFFSVKHFLETDGLRILKFGTNIRYDKLYYVRKNQSHIAYQSLYLSFFSSTQVSVTDISASSGAWVFNLCRHSEGDQVY